MIEPKQTAKEAARFLLVGGFCTAVDVALHYCLMYVFQFHGKPLSMVVGASLLRNPNATFHQAKTVAFPAFKLLTSGVAIVISFFLNRSFTFQVDAPERARRDFLRFIVVSLIGLGINAGVFAVVAVVLARQEYLIFGVGTVFAAGANAVWNFLGHKLWSFRD